MSGPSIPCPACGAALIVLGESVPPRCPACGRVPDGVEAIIGLLRYLADEQGVDECGAEAQRLEAIDDPAERADAALLIAYKLSAALEAAPAIGEWAQAGIEAAEGHANNPEP